MAEMSQEELNERVAILRKFRSLLEQQREKFREYLKVLEKQETSIEKEDSEKLLAHTELEQQVLSNIMNLQKVIVPMSEIYQKKNSNKDEASVIEIQNDLAELQQKVLLQNQKNRELLKTHIVEIRRQIDSLKNPYKNASSIYAQKSQVGSFVTVDV